MKNIDTPISKITLEVGAKHLRNLDRKIRNKWGQLYQYKKRSRRTPQTQNELSLKIKTQASMNSTFNVNKNPHSVQQLKAGNNRFATCQRNRRNNEIFFKKRSSIPGTSSARKQFSLNHLKEEKKLPSHKRYNTVDLKQEEKQSKLLPFMLQKRRKKLEKSIQIIDHLSYLSMKDLDLRQKNVFDKYQTEQRKLIDKMKGTKLYYQFVKAWKSPNSRQQF